MKSRFSIVLLTLTLLQINLFAQEEEVPLYSAPEKVQTGDLAPAFSGVDLQGNVVNSKDLLKQGEVVLVFYRGVWCPYCTKHLAVLQDSLGELTSRGAQLVVITPEQPSFIKETISKSGATFSILSDPQYQIMEDFGVAFHLSKETVPRYFNIVVNKTRKSNGNEEDVLPVPATFVIGQDGKVVYRHFDTDYTKRASVSSILEYLGE